MEDVFSIHVVFNSFPKLIKSTNWIVLGFFVLVQLLGFHYELFHYLAVVFTQ